MTLLKIRKAAKAAEACGELGLADKLFRDARKILLTIAKK